MSTDKSGIKKEPVIMQVLEILEKRMELAQHTLHYKWNTISETEIRDMCIFCEGDDDDGVCLCPPIICSMCCQTDVYDYKKCVIRYLQTKYEINTRVKDINKEELLLIIEAFTEVSNCGRISYTTMKRLKKMIDGELMVHTDIDSLGGVY